MSQEIAAAVESFINLKGTSSSLEDYVEELRAAGRLTTVVHEAAVKARQIRAEHDVIMYIAGPLTGVDQELKDRYEITSQTIASYEQPGAKMFAYAPHLHGTDPIKHPDVTPREVRDIDYLFASLVPDGHLNFMYPLGHGNAVELGWAEAAEIPTVSLIPRDMKLSRLVRGMLNLAGTIEYDDFALDGLLQIRNFLDELQTQLPSKDQ